LIINTLIHLKANARKESTLKETSYRLTRLSEQCNLNNPEQVKMTIANMTSNDKENYVKAYARLALANQIEWKQPYYHTERKIPTIPTRENIMKIISTAKKYAPIFKTLMETGLMPYELSQVEQRDIDLERGIINARGFKGHTSRTFKLTQETTAMLKTYFTKYQRFPESIWIQKMWIKHRNKTATKLQDITLKTIRLYDLRHYYATTLYAKTRDILLVKQQLGHHKIETTMIYTQLTHFNEEDEYTVKTANNVKDATDLTENGFEYTATTPDGYMLFRKRK
jgi:integrase